MAVSYNAALAFLNAHGLAITTSFVAASEILILAIAGLLIALKDFSRVDLPPVTLAYFGIAIGIYMSLLNDRPYLDGVRIFLIISAFTMLGARLKTESVDQCFLLLSIIILVFLIIELASTPLYVSLFKPADYFLATRGIEKFSLDKTGLFKNSLGFEGRLSLNPFSKYRTSSIFLEQVSLANYGGVLIAYLITRWPSIARKTKAIHIICLVLILMTTSTRTSISLSVIGLVGYWMYPRLSRLATLFVAPTLLLISWMIVSYEGTSNEDNLSGRLGRTITLLHSLSADSLLGTRTDLLPLFADSGYGYLIVSTTIFGALAFWFYVSLLIRQKTIDEKRCAWATALYFFVNLLISGTAIFSMKTAAPLWLLVGSIYGRTQSCPVNLHGRRDAFVS